MAWQPQPGQLGLLAQCLRDSLSGHDVAAQKQAEQMLKQAKASPDINNYLAYLCANPTNTTGMTIDSYHGARSAAAIMLKNNVKMGYNAIPEQSQTYIRSTILNGLQDSNAQIRNYAGNVITEVVRQGGILGWPQVLPELVSLVANQTGSASPEAQDGAMGAVFKICEDNRKALDKVYQEKRPLEYLLPQLLKFASHTNPKVRARALASINVFLGEPIPQSIRTNIDQLLPQLAGLAQDSNEDVRRYVCRAFALLADGLPESLVPHVDGIIDYAISQQKQHQNPDLALDAAEFFFEGSSQEVLRNALGPSLEKIIPVLLNSMVYSEDDQIRLEGLDEDADQEDKAEDIKPAFATSKTSRAGTDFTALPTSNGEQTKPSINGYAYDNDDDELSDGEIDDDDDDDDYGVDPEDEWNLRKCSAAALDSLALHFHGTVFDVTLPWLMENLNHKDWPNREAAVLAVGAIGPGCMDVISPHLPQLVPFMVSLLSDSQPVVRKISCWALSRFAGWASQLDATGRQQYFEPMLGGILERMLDSNKKVQESAASAFASLEEAASTQLTPYCHIIVRQFVKCFERYKDKNMFILYDCVQTLAESTGPALERPELVDLLMPALINRWQKVQDQSREMFPLLECLAFVATALGTSFMPFAKPFFMRCVKIIHQNLEDSNAASQFPTLEYDNPDKDYLVTSLDLLSSIIQSLNSQSSNQLAAEAQPNLFELLAYCMKDPNNDVRQSAYALLGDCAIYIFPRLQPHLPIIMEFVISQLDLQQAAEDPETGYRVINNACWSCGEIAMRQGAGMAPYVDRLLQKLAMIMFAGHPVPDNLAENAAIALGRLGLGCHQQLAPHLATFAAPFLRAIRKVAWTDEKGHAYKGFTLVVLDNPQAMEQCLLDFFSEMACAPASLLAMEGDGPFEGFCKVLGEYQRLIGAGWDQFLHNLPAAEEQALRQIYKL